MKRITAAMLSLLLTAALLAGCGMGSVRNSEENDLSPASEYYSSQSAGSSINKNLADTREEEKYNSASPETEKTAGETLSSPTQKLIKTVWLTMQTQEFEETVEALKQMVVSCGGYIETSSVSGRSYSSSASRSASFTLRIPSDGLELFTDDLTGLGNVVRSEENVTDVSLTYADYESRLKALTAQRDSLLAMLEKADNLSDLLTVQDHLTDVEYRIESYSSKLLVLQNQISYSTVNLQLNEVKAYSEPEPETFGEKIRRGFKESLQGVCDFFVGIAVFLLGNLPVLLVIAAFIFLLILLIRRARKKRKARKEARRAQTPPAEG